MCGANVTQDSSAGELEADDFAASVLDALFRCEWSTLDESPEYLLFLEFSLDVPDDDTEADAVGKAKNVSHALTSPPETVRSSILAAVGACGYDPPSPAALPAALWLAPPFTSSWSARGSGLSEDEETPVFHMYTVVEFSLPQRTNFPLGEIDALSLEPVLLWPRNSDTGFITSMRKRRRRESLVDTKNQSSHTGSKSTPSTRVLCLRKLRRARTSTRETS
mmetsp:Transcript_10471/g.22139  ORF Transcript_10471/g.22139 Transcript_10471/m.22139 type:complete len:221 (+) Transcript_10471:1145-1807(+)